MHYINARLTYLLTYKVKFYDGYTTL